ncbi:MAG: type 4a pilus biogenesis protein PilO [Firmicutes bacterium]|nr:type 4a pilus biogenesis protein PilO [Bacillota bacterium]
MKRPARHWKRRVRVTLGLIVLADLVLAGLVIRSGAQPTALREERDRLAMQFRQLSDDVVRAQAVRSNLPKVAQQCANFFEQQFLDASRGYSAVLTDFTRLAQRAGLEIQRIGFRQDSVDKRQLTEVRIEVNVEGDYPALVRFINGLERSEHFYLMNSLALASSTAGRIKLTLEVKTYFRNALPQAVVGG